MASLGRTVDSESIELLLCQNDRHHVRAVMKCVFDPVGVPVALVCHLPIGRRRVRPKQIGRDAPCERRQQHNRRRARPLNPFAAKLVAGVSGWSQVRWSLARSSSLVEACQASDEDGDVECAGKLFEDRQ
jgi:hypothetical protein